MDGSVPVGEGIHKLGQYTIIRSLGEGTFGKVKLAVHTLSGQHVALKFIQKGRINRMKVRTRIVREIEYLKQLKHPHIIKLYEVINTPKEVIMVMEYAGGELFNYIVENGRLPESEARRFFQQMLYGLAYSHSHNIVHRDIKPENVLLDDANNVKLADFGLSNEIRDGSWLSTSCGSPNYAAPEVISGSLYAGPEIDVWSLGVILYVMLCGRLPFEDEHVPALFQKIASGRYHVPSYLSPDAKILIAGMLVVDPMKRLSVQDLLSHPWSNTSLPPYLSRMKPQLNPGREPSTLTSLLEQGGGPDWLGEDIGYVDASVVQELAGGLGVDEGVVRGALEGDGENAVKVAYKLVQDRNLGYNLDAVGKKPTPPPSTSSAQPIWIPPSGPKQTAYGDQPQADELFTEGEGYTEEDEDEEDEDGTGPPLGGAGSFESSSNGTATIPNNFNWLDTASNGTVPPSPVFTPSNHHLANYANSRSALSASRGRISVTSATPGPVLPPPAVPPTPPTSHSSKKKREIKPPRWHFGIRSSSPPMEVMLELYRTLEALGIEWREKRGVWSGDESERRAALIRLEQQGQFGGPVVSPGGESENGGDGAGSTASFGDETSRESLDIYYVEARWRLRQTVLLFDLQLYQVDAMNYLVDFRDLGYYVPSSEPGAGRFDPADTSSVNDEGERKRIDGDYPHPLLFLDCACRLILELAGGSG